MLYRKVKGDLIVEIQQGPTGNNPHAQWYKNSIGNIYNVDECYIWDDNYYYILLNKNGEQTEAYILKRDAKVIDRYKKIEKICLKLEKK